MPPVFTWDLVADIRELFAFPFMVNALVAGTAVAVLAGVVGWFVVLRGESFAAHTLAVIGFPGAAGVSLLGISPALGYFAMTAAGAAVIARSTARGGPRRLEETAVIGTLQACALALGYFFVTIGHRNLSTAQTLLFGSFLGISDEQVWLLLAVTALLLVMFAVIARPLLFASVDAQVALARGVPTTAVAYLFVFALGAAVAEASQITGSLLVFALLVMPAASAQAITPRPALGIALAVGLALVVTWSGLAVSYYSNYPVGFTVTSVAFAVLLATRVGWIGDAMRRQVARA